MNITIDIQFENKELQRLRKAAGLSQGKLAKESGISVKTIQAYESGARNLNDAKLGTLLQLALALGCTLEELVTDEMMLSLLKKYKER